MTRTQKSILSFLSILACSIGALAFWLWQEQWDIVGVPVVRVYGRDGKLARQFDNRDPNNQFTYQDVEAFVRGLQ